MRRAPASPDPARARRAWFKAQARLAAGPLRGAAAFTVLDGGFAIAFAAGLAIALTALPRGSAATLPGAGLMLAGALGRGLMGRLAAGRGAEAAARIKAAVRGRVMRAALEGGPGVRPPVGHALTQAVEGVEALDGYYARFVPARTAAGVAPLLAAAAMAFASPIAAAIVLATFAPFVLAMALAGGAAATEARRQFEALGRLSALFADRVRALPAVLAFGAEARTTAELEQAAGELAERTLRVLRIAFVSSGALEFFAALSVALVAVYCGFDLLRLLPFPAPERLTLAQAVFVLALAPEAYLPMRRLAAAYHDRQAAEAAADALIALDETPVRPAGAAARAAGAPAIRFDGVRVVYPGEARPALDGFSLSVRPGEVVALVGPTGAGKSTVLNLLLGLAAASAGRVEVGGAALAPGEGAPAAWASQAPVVAPGTLGDNLRLAHRDASAAALQAAAEAAGLSAVPGGLARAIDERGGGLSGGERRRLALARAILRDAPLLLLDEPTANLDAASEAALLPAIARAARGRTTLIATHSPAVAALADRIVRLAA